MTPESCPHCGARVVNREATDCWKCGESLTGAATGRAAPPAPPDDAISAGVPPQPSASGIQAEPPHEHRPPGEEPAADNPVIAAIGLLALLSALTLIAGFALGVAIVLAVVITPALVRVAYYAAKEVRPGNDR